jgi:hypothetical protein
MLDKEFATIVGAGDQQLVFAQACLDLFEKDRGRPAYAMLEIRNWADVQDPENLRFRILRRVRADQDWTKACKRIWHDRPESLVSRPPLGQRSFLALSEAARVTGKSTVTILSAIGEGRIVGMKDVEEIWHVDRDSLCQAFPFVQTPVGQSDSTNDRPLDAAAVVLEMEISALVRQAFDKLRQGRI